MATKEKEQTLSVDDQFLKDFLAKGGKAETESGTPVDADNVDTLLEEAGGTGGTPKQAALHQKAINAGMADTSKEDAIKVQREQERNDRLRAQELKKQRGKAIDIAAKSSTAAQKAIIDPVIQKAGNAADRVSSLRTVGGIGLLLAILIFLLFVIVQVNSEGDTRIKQFWYMLNGRAKLEGRQTIGTSGQQSSSSLPTGTPGVNLPGGVSVSTGLSPNKPTTNIGPIAVQYTPDIIPTPWGTITIPDISIGARPITGG